MFAKQERGEAEQWKKKERSYGARNRERRSSCRRPCTAGGARRRVDRPPERYACEGKGIGFWVYTFLDSGHVHVVLEVGDGDFAFLTLCY